MTLPKEVVGGEAVTVFGHAPGVKPGAKFKDRGQLVGVGQTARQPVHRWFGFEERRAGRATERPPSRCTKTPESRPVGPDLGVTSQPCQVPNRNPCPYRSALKHADYELGAYSVVMSGGYVDDEDMGESFWYTGEGGIDKGRQVKDQVFDRGANAALRNNCESRTPVRVIRGYVHARQGAEVGAATGGGGKEKGFVYEGLYVVLQCKQEPSKDGPLVCKFLMHGVPGHSTVNAKVEFGIFGGVSTAGLLHARRLARGVGAAGEPAAAHPAKRARIDKERKMGQANRKVMLADIHRRYPPKVLLSEDVSNGQEPVPIPLINEVNDETLPDSFQYTREYSWAPGVYQLVAPILRFADEEMAEFTKARQHGSCGLAFNKHLCALDRGMGDRLPQGYEPHLEEQYNASGCLMVTDPCGVHECGAACTSARCRLNKQLTNGVALPLEVFMTPAKGWGVRCREPVLAGAFVCAYVGQLVTDHMAEVRKGVDHYLFDLDFFAHIYTEMAAKGLDSISQEIPLHKIPPVLSVGMVRHMQTVAAKAVRERPAAAGDDKEAAAARGTTTAAADADAEASGQQPAGGVPGASSPGSTAVDADGLMPREAVHAAAKDLLASCNALAAATSQPPGGNTGGGGDGADADGSNGQMNAAASALLRLQDSGVAAGGESGPCLVAAPPQPPGGAGCSGQAAAKGAALTSAAAAVAEASAADPGAFYMQPIFSKDDVEARPPPAEGAAAGEEEEYAPILVLDARSTGNVGRFINHSCDGNLTIQAVFAREYRNTLLYHVGLYACKDIPRMQELTYNYGYHSQASRTGGMYGMECHCGAENCVGQLM